MAAERTQHRKRSRGSRDDAMREPQAKADDGGRTAGAGLAGRRRRPRQHRQPTKVVVEITYAPEPGAMDRLLDLLLDMLENGPPSLAPRVRHSRRS